MPFFLRWLIKIINIYDINHIGIGVIPIFSIGPGKGYGLTEE